MGICRQLLSGQPVIDEGGRVIKVVDAGGCVKHTIPFASLRRGYWGLVYERHCGLVFESQGFSVTYWGLSKGFLDGGMDLIIENDEGTKYVQCKYMTSQKIGKQDMERLLYKASLFLTKKYQGTKLNFALVVPRIKDAMPEARRQYFLSKNQTQNYCHLEIIEIPFGDCRD
jgi:hypothetical protein